MSHLPSPRRRSTWPWTIAALTLIVSGALVWALRFSPAAIQQRNMDLAEAHNQRLESTLRAEPRFSDVRLGTYTGFDGGGSISGEVKDAATAEELLAIVLRSQPPRPILWTVSVAPPGNVQYYLTAPRKIMPDGTVQRNGS